MRTCIAFATLSALALSVPTAHAQTAGSAPSGDAAAAKAVLRQYQQAVEKLDTTGTHRLFTADSQVFESGGVEGTFKHYAAHHLGPELREFSAFTFSDYQATVTVDGSYAFATETYTYTITLKKAPQDKEAKAPKLPDSDDIVKGVMLTRGGAVVHPNFVPSQAACSTIILPLQCRLLCLPVLCQS